MFDGDWESGNLDKLMPGKVGFFLMPTLKAGAKHTAMSAPLTYGIAAKAKHADCAAFFFNWVATNPKARKINVAVGGSNPGGPPNLPIPVPKNGTVIGPDARGRQGRREGRTARWTSSRTRHGRSTRSRGRLRCRSCSPGQEDPAGVLSKVQADYEQQVKSGG